MTLSEKIKSKFPRWDIYAVTRTERFLMITIGSQDTFNLSDLVEDFGIFGIANVDLCPYGDYIEITIYRFDEKVFDIEAKQE